MLRCPQCDAAPAPGGDTCPGCGRRLRSPRGGLDLLTDAERAEADRFTADYVELRTREGWVGGGAREDPQGGNPRLWRDRSDLVARAARLMRDEIGESPLVLDVGAGGGWAAGRLGGARVIAIDLLDVGESDGLSVRGDMRRLPVRDAAADAALYAASLHYAPVMESVPEAARVLRPGGLLIALDSPLYSYAQSTELAAKRSASYFEQAGHPGLAAHYHPIDRGLLRETLVASGFDVLQLTAGARWRALLRRSPGSFVVARRLT